MFLTQGYIVSSKSASWLWLAIVFLQMGESLIDNVLHFFCHFFKISGNVILVKNNSPKNDLLMGSAQALSIVSAE